MKNNSAQHGAVLGMFTVIISQAILRSIEVFKISTQIYITISITVGIIFLFIMIKNRNKWLGVRLSLTAGILTFIACILNSISLILTELAPHKEITKALVILSVGSFFALVIFWVIASSIVLKDKH